MTTPRRFKLYDNYSTWFSLSNFGRIPPGVSSSEENIIIALCSGPSQNDIRNFARRSNIRTVKMYTPISIKVS